MKSATRHAIALTVLVAFAAPSHADWEGTQWGMSPDEALAVLDGANSHSPAASEIFEFDGASYEPLIKLAHAAEGIEGEAALLFDADERLQFVVFNPSDLAQCDALAAALDQVHGAADATGFGSTSIFNWAEGDNAIRLTNSTDIGICTLSYGAF